MISEASFIDLALRSWKANIDRAGSFFGALSQEELQSGFGPFSGLVTQRPVQVAVMPRPTRSVASNGKKGTTNCAVEHHILRRSSYVSEESPIYGRRAHHGGPGLLPRRGNRLGDTGRQCERRSHFRSKIALQALESGLGRDKARQERSERACASSATDHAVGHIPCQCGTTGVCDSLLSGRQEVSGQLPPQGMHVGGSFSRSVQLREIARENNPGQSGWSDPGKGALTFFGLNCADKKNNTSGVLRE